MLSAMSTPTLLALRALIRLSPTDPEEDVRGFLQGLVTQDTKAVTPGNPQYAGLLSAQGKAMFDFLLWDDGADVLIDCEADVTDALAKRLTIYRLRRRISIARDETLQVYWSPEPVEGAAGIDHGVAEALGAGGVRHDHVFRAFARRRGRAPLSIIPRSRRPGRHP